MKSPEAKAASAARVDRRLWWSVGLNAAVTVAEIAGGLVAGSLALLADALHNLSDVAALVLTIAARRLGRRPPSLKYTYGLKRLEVFSALVNAVVLLVVVGFIAVEAIRRLSRPQPVLSSVMLVVALLALSANAGAVLLLRRAGREDLNIRSAVAHLLQDAFASLVVVAAAAFGRTAIGPYLDPAASLVVCLAVTRSAFSIVWEALGMLAEGVPRGVDVARLAEEITAQFAPARIHHLHVWEVGPGQRALTAHISVPDMSVSAAEEICIAIRRRLGEAWGITHATLELEVNGCGDPGLLGGAEQPSACWESSGRTSLRTGARGKGPR